MCDFSSATFGDDRWVIFTFNAANLIKKRFEFFIMRTNNELWKYPRCEFAQLMKFDEVKSIKPTRHGSAKMKKSNIELCSCVEVFCKHMLNKLLSRAQLKVHFVKCGKRFEGTCWLPFSVDHSRTASNFTWLSVHDLHVNPLHKPQLIVINKKQTFRCNLRESF